MKKQINPLSLSYLLAINLFLCATVFAQEEVNIYECGKPLPCVMTSTSKAKMPVPCNCIPKMTNLLDAKFTIKSAASDKISAKIVNSQGKVFAKTDAPGGRVDYDKTQGVATLRLGAVDKSLSRSSLKLVVTTFTAGANGRLVEKKYTVDIEP
jgi:hypothetical protein